MASANSEGERVRVLYIGEPMHSALPYFIALINDPFFDVTPVQAFTYEFPTDVARRSVRRYMPRTYERLAGYGVVTLVYADAQLFDPKHKSWISKAALEGGTGVTLTGQPFAGNNWLWEWIESSVGDALPIERPLTSEGGNYHISEPASVKVNSPTHPLMVSLPWSEMGRHGIFAGYTLIGARQGSEVLAQLVPAFGQAYPFLVWWEVGQGRAFATMTYFTDKYKNPHDPFFEWPYLGDFACNYHLLAGGRRVPQDTTIIHEIRTTMVKAHAVKNALVGSIEFISKLGGNPAQLEEMLREADEKLKDARRSYLQYEFHLSLKHAQDLVGDLGTIGEMTVELKDQTLVSIYAIEWMVLLSASMVTGIVTWSLMVRRRLYSEVKATRLTKEGEIPTHLEAPRRV